MYKLAIGLFAVNLASALVMQTALAASLGFDQTIAGSERVDQAEQKGQEQIESGGPSDSTLLGLYTTVTEQVSTFLSIMAAGPTMLNQIGFPGTITNIVVTPLVFLIYGLGIAQFLRGFNL